MNFKPRHALLTAVAGALFCFVLVGASATSFVGDPWAEVGGSASGGGISSTSGTSSSPSLAIDSAGNPCVAWIDSTSGNDEVYFKRWNGTAWVELGGSGSGSGVSATGATASYPSLRLDPSGNPIISWVHTTAPRVTDVYLKHWNGSSWVQLGGSATGGGISGTAEESAEAVLAVDSSGTPFVTWWEDLGAVGDDTAIFLKYWNGSAWVELGGSATGGGISGNTGGSQGPKIVLDSAGYPVIAWRNNPAGNFDTFVKRWNGSAWLELGGSGSGGGVSSTGKSADVAVGVDSAGNPVVAWSDYTPGDNVVHLKKWNGAAWAELAGSATGNGVSGGLAHSILVSLAVDAQDYPVVSWSAIPHNYCVFVKHWDGAAWMPYGDSDSGSGIGAAGGGHSSLAMDPNQNPVAAWQTDGEVYLKRWSLRFANALIEQRNLFGSTLAIGAQTSRAVRLGGTLTSGLALTSLQMQVEIQPIGTDFTGIPTSTSQFESSGTQLEIRVAPPPGSYHWQARVEDSLGNTSGWMAFGNNAESSADFRIGSWAGGGGGCGLLGLEPLFLLWLGRALRRLARKPSARRRLKLKA